MQCAGLDEGSARLSMLQSITVLGMHAGFTGASKQALDGRLASWSCGMMDDQSGRFPFADMEMSASAVLLEAAERQLAALASKINTLQHAHGRRVPTEVRALQHVWHRLTASIDQWLMRLCMPAGRGCCRLSGCHPRRLAGLQTVRRVLPWLHLRTLSQQLSTRVIHNNYPQQSFTTVGVAIGTRTSSTLGRSCE